MSKVKTYYYDIEVPKDIFTIVHTVKPEDWTPGAWAGGEGMKFTITKIDLETRTITLELLNENM